jgi:hypothetical protein
MRAGRAVESRAGPVGAIQEVRELLGPHTPQFVAALVELAQSPNEMTRLAAIREAFDRLLGKAPLAVDTTSTNIETSIQALYLTALKEINSRPDPRTVEASAATDVTPQPDACNAATDW